MKKPKTDPSLAEVRRWRKNLRLDCEGISPEEEIECIHQNAQEVIQNYDLKLRSARSRKSKIAM